MSRSHPAANSWNPASAPTTRGRRGTDRRTSTAGARLTAVSCGAPHARAMSASPRIRFAGVDAAVRRASRVLRDATL
jgi:hypothetical protein